MYDKYTIYASTARKDLKQSILLLIALSPEYTQKRLPIFDIDSLLYPIKALAIS